MHLETLAQDLVKELPGGGGRASADPHDSRFDVLARLVGAMRMLDEATSLKGILEGLARGGAGQADRAAVFVLEGQTLRAFARIRLHRLAEAGRRAGRQLRRAGARGERPPADDGVDGGGPVPSDVPAFMRPGTGKAGVVVPLVVGGNVVALVFADGPDGHAGADAAGWTESIEVLVRHAASRLENVTSSRTVEVLTKPA